jgi:hypothetical protein
MSANKRPRLDTDNVAPARAAPSQIYIPMLKIEGKWESIDAAYVQEADAVRRIKEAKAANAHSADDDGSESSGYEEAELWGYSDDYDEGNIDHPPRYKLWVLSVQY